MHGVKNSAEVVKNMVVWREQALEALGGGGVKFQPVEDGEIFLVPHPLAMTEEQNAAVEDAKGNVAIAKALLGEAGHTRFVAAGGQSGDVLLAWRQLTEAMNNPK